jgi:hypothetical protein
MSPESMHMTFVLVERDRLMNPDARARAAIRANHPRRRFRTWLDSQRRQVRRAGRRSAAPAYEAGGAA